MTPTRRILAATAALALGVLGATAQAAPSAPRSAPAAAAWQGPAASHREAAHEARVLARLQDQAADLAQLRSRALRDGHLDRAERQRIEAARTRLEREVRVAVHRGDLSPREARQFERQLTPVAYHERVHLPQPPHAGHR
ncbi:hypothetical protein [Piscinibacter sakaiensis]|uniref:Zinc resistance-associated protein n=1 Tax=Piscinibacter sakaiensis TaxID=1547922 RepID=A0A0K8NYT0_PISS1|nr:hypothetical protein [Piscinibacter sakaiensis]GAP35459.1 hypothetical protein ISF6_1232 [Piscinibacter sakaiensis]